MQNKKESNWMRLLLIWTGRIRQKGMAWPTSISAPSGETILVENALKRECSLQTFISLSFVWKGKRHVISNLGKIISFPYIDFNNIFPLCLTFVASLFGTFLPRFSDLAFPPSQYELSRRLSPYLTKKENWIVGESNPGLLGER